jgi:Bacterial dipeptidyl-peptidase Sh3 domain/NlpC/P60 family
MMDKRLHVYRVDLADARLQGHVQADRFVSGMAVQFMAPCTPVHRAPQHDAMQVTQALMGETALVFEQRDGWAWVQLDHDQYVGYVRSESLSVKVLPTTHQVCFASTLIYPKPDLKTQPAILIPMNAKLVVIGEHGQYSELATGGFVFTKHISADVVPSDYVAIAEMFLNVTYLWGGKTQSGLDCSGLVQTALHACGISCPRDADMQEKELGTALQINDLDGLKRGDLVFWEGHVGMMYDESNLIHANGFHMQTVIEPLKLAATRIADSDKPITSLKRL